MTREDGQELSPGSSNIKKSEEKKKPVKGLRRLKQGASGVREVKKVHKEKHVLCAVLLDQQDHRMYVPFTLTKMELESITLSKINQPKTNNDFSQMWELRNKINEQREKRERGKPRQTFNYRE